MLGCLFGLGIFVIIATALRIFFTIKGGNIQNMTFWSMIETCTAIVVANAPGVRTLNLKQGIVDIVLMDMLDPRDICTLPGEKDYC